MGKGGEVVTEAIYIKKGNFYLSGISGTVVIKIVEKGLFGILSVNQLDY